MEGRRRGGRGAHGLRGPREVKSGALSDLGLGRKWLRTGRPERVNEECSDAPVNGAPLGDPPW